MRFRDIPQFSYGKYEVDMFLEYLPDKLKEWQDELGLELCPDFQRGRVWTDEQQSRYVEYLLQGGQAARVIYFNHPGWMNSFVGEFVCMDGLQRLTACLRFMSGELTAFGHYRHQFEDKPHNVTLRFNINNLKHRRDVLRWYIDFNRGGTVHTDEDIARVKVLLKAEKEA